MTKAVAKLKEFIKDDMNAKTKETMTTKCSRKWDSDEPFGNRIYDLELK